MIHSEPLFYSVLAFLVGFSACYLMAQYVNWRQK